jgi:uncharacterized protein (TIGR00369 family)
MTPIQLQASDWESGYFLPHFPVPPIAEFLGTHFESHDPDEGVLRVSFPTKAEYANPGGMVMGGIVASFLDDAMGPLVVAASGGKNFPVTLDLHITYFKPVPIGPRAVVEARIDRIGRSTVFTNASVISENGEELARAVHTATLRPIDPDS